MLLLSAHLSNITRCFSQEMRPTMKLKVKSNETTGTNYCFPLISTGTGNVGILDLELPKLDLTS